MRIETGRTTELPVARYPTAESVAYDGTARGWHVHASRPSADITLPGAAKSNRVRLDHRMTIAE
jgi:hypothetical protein